MEPDGYCRFGNPYFVGFMGIGTHDCEECRTNIRPDHLLTIFRQCFLDHEKVWMIGLHDEPHCDDCEVEVEEYEGYEEDGHVVEPWTSVRYFHRISPECISLNGIVMESQENRWGHDVIVEMTYTNGTPWDYRALYGFSTSTGVASCYAD